MVLPIVAKTAPEDESLEFPLSVVSKKKRSAAVCAGYSASEALALESPTPSLAMASTYGSDSWPGCDGDSQPAKKRVSGRCGTQKQCTGAGPPRYGQIC